MSNNKLYLFVVFIFSSCLISTEVAIVTKNNGSVKYKKENTKRFTNKINSGFELYNNDLLVTGNDGFIMFAYLDDGSLIKVHKDSEVIVDGNLNNKIINKQVLINDGFIKFNIKKQKQNEFKIVTPTSVASVKGTIFYIDTSSDGDVFYGFDGEVEVQNIASNEISSLTQNKKLTSLQDGSMEIENIVEEDIEYIVQVQQESGIEIDEIQEINDFEEQQPDINNQQGTGNVETEEIQNVIITFTDENGQQKQIIIKFVEK